MSLILFNKKTINRARNPKNVIVKKKKIINKILKKIKIYKKSEINLIN